MALGVFRLPRRFPIQQPLQLAQVVHIQPMEISPAGNSKQVVDHHGSISLTGQAFLANQLFSSFLGIVMIVIGTQQFHGVSLLKLTFHFTGWFW